MKLARIIHGISSDQAQASPRAKKAHLAATQEEEKQPMRVTRHKSKAIFSRPIRCKHEDPWAHMEQETNLREGLSLRSDTWDIRATQPTKGEVGWA
jgi:hypothetical protein